MSLELQSFGNPCELRRPLGVPAPAKDNVIIFVTQQGFECPVQLFDVAFYAGMKKFLCLWFPLSMMGHIPASVSTIWLPASVTLNDIHKHAFYGVAKHGPKGTHFPFSWEGFKDWTIST